MLHHNSRPTLLALNCSAILIAINLIGCLLEPPKPIPSNDPLVACEAMVRNPSIPGPDGELSQVLYTFNMDGVEDLRLAINEQCPYDVRSLPQARLQWEALLGGRIEQLTEAGNNVFAEWPRGWCVEPATLSCASTNEPIVTCAGDYSELVRPRLPDCLPPPRETCLEVCSGNLCRDAFSQSLDLDLDFGEVPTGQLVEKILTLENCGLSSSEPIALQFDGTVTTIGSVADFAVAQPKNQCYSDPSSEPLALSPGESCSFSVAFRPEAPFNHRGDIQVLSDASSGTIKLGGFGAPGRLVFRSSDPALADNQLTLGCREEPPCTAIVPVELANVGQGAVNINGSTQEGSTRFLMDPAELFQQTLAAGDHIDLNLRWCGVGGNDSGRLIVQADGTSTGEDLILELTREALPDCVP